MWSSGCQRLTALSISAALSVAPAEPVRGCARQRTRLPILWMGPSLAAGLGGPPSTARTAVRAQVCPPIRMPTPVSTARHGLRRSHHLYVVAVRRHGETLTQPAAAVPAALQSHRLVFLSQRFCGLDGSRRPAKCALCAVEDGFGRSGELAFASLGVQGCTGCPCGPPQPSVAVARVCMVGHVAHGGPMWVIAPSRFEGVNETRFQC